MKPPSEADIRRQLERLLGADGLVRSPRLQQLLTHVVERTLAGDAESLKGAIIAKEVFDRPEFFDPKTDALVRVNATRLRRVLEAHYLKDGRFDPVEIRLDAGSYVPVFAIREVEEPALPRQDRPWLPWGIAIVAVAALAGGALWSTFNTPGSDLAETVAEVVQAPGEGPIVIIDRQDNSQGRAAASLNAAFAEMLAQDLVRFRSLQVRLGEAGFKATDRITDAYRLLASVEKTGEGYTFSVRIQDPVGQLLWAHQVTRPLAADTYAAVTAEVAAVVAARVGQPFGIINSAEIRRAQNAPRLGAGPYLCVLSFYEYQRLRTAATHRAARTCLLQAVESAPRYSDAWAALSLTILDEERFGFNRQPQAVDRAAAAGERALTLDPENALAHRAAAVAAFASGEMHAFEVSARQALEANPNSPDTLAEIGSYLVFSGQFKDGEALLRRAMTLSPGHPGWYHMALVLAALNTDRNEDALLDAKAGRDANVALSLWLLAAAQVRNDLPDDARATLRQLKRLDPAFAANALSPSLQWAIKPEVAGVVGAILTESGL